MYMLSVLGGIASVRSASQRTIGPLGNFRTPGKPARQS